MYVSLRLMPSLSEARGQSTDKRPLRPRSERAWALLQEADTQRGPGLNQIREAMHHEA